MAYIITRSDITATPIVVDDGTVNSTPPLTIGLVGRNTIDYGQPIATAQVHTLENFANGTSPLNPVPGQIWYNNSTKTLNVNTGSGDGASLAVWTPLVASSGPVQPEDPALTGLSNIGASSQPSVPDSLIMSTGPDTFVYLPITLFAQGLLNDADAATMRTTLGLGNAATATLQTTDLDVTDDRVLTVGAFGLGATLNQPVWINTSLDNCTGAASGFYITTATTTTSSSLPSGFDVTNCVLEFRVRNIILGSQVQYYQQLTDVQNNRQIFRTSTSSGTVAAPIWAGWIEPSQSGGSGGSGSYQPIDPILTSLSGLVLAPGDMVYAVDSTTLANTPSATYGRSLLTATSAANAQTLLALQNSATIVATTAATGSTIVLRNADGSLPVTAISGNAATATALQTARTINGVSFDGTANIVVFDNTKLPINGSSPMTGQLQVTYSSGATPGYTAGQAQLISGSSNPVVLGFTRTGSGAALVHTGNGLELQGATWGSRGNFACASLTVTGTIVASGTITSSGDVIAFSDARLKTNITVISDAVAKINTLQGVTYDRIDTGERQTGLIAQEVQAILPEAVHESEDEDKTLGLAYGNLAGLFVEAIKEMSATIARLEAEITILKAKTNG